MQQTNSPNMTNNRFSIPYLPILGVLVIVVMFSFLWRPLNFDRTTYIPLSPQIETTVIEKQNLPAGVGSATVEIVDSNITDEQQISESSDQPKPEDNMITDEIDEAIDQNDDVITHVVSRGDTLYGIMMGYGVSRSDIYLLTKQYKKLANLRIGQKISWSTNADHELKTFNWTISNNNTQVYERNGDKFTERTETREGVWKSTTINGTIDANFVVDAKKIGLTNNEITAITKSLQWQLDFRLLRKGDQYSVLLSREMFGELHENSKLLAVRIKNGSKDYYAVLAEDGQYYDMNGASLSQSFLRYPLEKQARISSLFNPRRLNPVTKKITPHNGVDFAVSRGTPVLSVGDGEVVIAKYSGSAGNFIAIRHGRQYATRYMHLDKILVKAGQKVKKGDRIGLSGNTGRSTGPHLHYELHIDGKPINPLTASLPVSGGLTGKSKTSFLEQFQEIKRQLAFESEKIEQNDDESSVNPTQSESAGEV